MGIPHERRAGKGGRKSICAETCTDRGDADVNVFCGRAAIARQICRSDIAFIIFATNFTIIFVLFLDFMGHIFLFQHFTNHINQLNIEAINLVKVDYFVSTSISSLFLVSLNNTDFVDEEDIDLLLF